MRDPFLQAALDEALTGLKEGGVPVGAVLVHEGKIAARGHNRRVQNGNPMLHGETDALTAAGRHPAEFYRQCKLYTTLSPCIMCAGAIALYQIPEVVIGENVNFAGEIDFLHSRGIKVTVINDPEIIAVMKTFIDRNPALWFEDISKEK